MLLHLPQLVFYVLQNRKEIEKQFLHLAFLSLGRWGERSGIEKFQGERLKRVQ